MTLLRLILGEADSLIIAINDELCPCHLMSSISCKGFTVLSGEPQLAGLPRDRIRNRVAETHFVGHLDF